MKRKIITLLIIFLLGVSPTYIISAKTSNSLLLNFEKLYKDDWHIIKNVPYVGQETGFDCEICSFTMLSHYLEKNYSLYDIFYLTGSGHALSYKPRSEFKNLSQKLSPPQINPGSLYSIWKKDWYLISDILGVSCNITYLDEDIDKKNKKEAWEEYWDRVKTYIKNDIPVYTHVDMSFLSYNKKHKIFPEGEGICHAIVIVGYNETNETVCINDPGPAYDGYPEEGMYFFENFSRLKKAVENSTKSPFIIYKYGYLTLTLENKSKPLPKELAYEMIHYRNLGKMDGRPWSYDGIFIEENKQLGINALNYYKLDMNPLRIAYNVPYWIFVRIFARIIDKNSTAPFYFMLDFIRVIRDEKKFVSQSLLKIKNCSFCKNEADLFENESQKWGEIYVLYRQFINIIEQGKYFKVFFKMIPIFFKMNKIIDEIIVIEKMILKNECSNMK